MTAGNSGSIVMTVVNRAAVILWSSIALTILLVLVDLFDVATNAATLRAQAGVDYRLYVDAAAAWLHGAPYFQPYQLAGPYPITPGDILYPPSGLILFVPFTVLPALLWWLIPVASVGWCLIRLKPEPSSWPWIAVCAAWPTTPLKFLTGNPVIWVVAALAFGVVYAWPSVLVLLKPSLAPFALFGVRSTRWWIALGLLVAFSLPFGDLWLDWVRAILNSQGGGLAYSSLEIPMVALPVVVWIGRRKVVEVPSVN